jgi:hypothetical protein
MIDVILSNNGITIISGITGFIGFLIAKGMGLIARPKDELAQINSKVRAILALLIVFVMSIGVYRVLIWITN